MLLQLDVVHVQADWHHLSGQLIQCRVHQPDQVYDALSSGSADGAHEVGGDACRLQAVPHVLPVVRGVGDIHLIVSHNLHMHSLHIMPGGSRRCGGGEGGGDKCQHVSCHLAASAAHDAHCSQEA